MAVVAGKIAAIVCSIVGPTFAILVWLSVTFSHREEKHIVTCGVIQHIAVSDITGNSTAAQARSLGSDQDPPLIQPSPQRKFPFKLPLNWAAFSHSSSHDGHSAFPNGQPSVYDGQQGLSNGQSEQSAGQDYLPPFIQLAAINHTTAASETAVNSTLGRSSSFTQGTSLISASRSPATAYSHIAQQVHSHQPPQPNAPCLPPAAHPFLPSTPSHAPARPLFTQSLSLPPFPTLQGFSSLLPILSPHAHTASSGVQLQLRVLHLGDYQYCSWSTCSVCYVCCKL